jgi:hypothetical protein
MEFKTDAHKRAYEKTRDFLHTFFGEVNVNTMADMFVLQEGSTFVYIRTFPIGDKESGVEIFSYVVVDIDVTEELMRYLLTYNLRLMLGAFGLSLGESAKGTVLLTHTLLGDSMDREGLCASVTAIARVADELDDKIVADFGGKTALDKLMTTQRAPIEYWE